MKLIYIAGPYRSTTEWQRVQNIRDAEAAALSVWRAGGAALCPHKNTAMFGGAYGLEDKVWLEGDIEMLGRCDGVLLCANWQLSDGTTSERLAAVDRAIPIAEVEKFHHINQLAAWIADLPSRAAKSVTAQDVAEMVRAFVERELTGAQR